MPLDRAFRRRAFLRRAFGVTGVATLLAACSERLTATTTGTTGPRPTTAEAPTGTTSNTTTSTSTSTTTSTSTSTTTSSTTTPHSSTSSSAAPTAPGSVPGAYDREALYVALYGHPGNTTLGVLGEQPAEAGADRAREVAGAYEGFGRRVVPTFEIIASVASAEAGSDGDFSNEFSSATFDPHLAVAAQRDMHVVFDLQTGRSRFPDQARQYEELWLHPHVSIALDPEWRVGDDQRPGGGRIGTVDAAEVNETIDYLDALVAAHGLPPKMCIVHQFAESMITDKRSIRGTEHVQVVLHMDGFGTLALKRATWARVMSALPDGAFSGWKNFYDEDQPTPTPAETMANDPAPRFVSFQ